jgi:pentose-5-phosphate-3-epimerase
MGIVVPAVLPGSRQDLDEKLALLAAIPAVSRIQIDVVDGQFASPASWPHPDSSSPETTGRPTELELMAQRGETLPHLDRIEYEIDLMCLDVARFAEPWLTLGASRLTFHAESAADLPRLLAYARTRYGSVVSLGLALNIASDLALLDPVLGNIDYVQFMGIARIGLQGQPFDERALEKIRVFRARHRDVPVQIDGGVSLGNARKLLGLGVVNLVVGSAILRAHDPSAALAALEMCQNHYEA